MAKRKGLPDWMVEANSRPAPVRTAEDIQRQTRAMVGFHTVIARGYRAVGDEANAAQADTLAAKCRAAV